MSPARRALAAVLVVVVFGLGVAAVVAPRRPAGAAIEIHEVHEGSFLPVPGQPIFMLALGSDGRAGLVGQRADAIHLIGVNPGAGAGTMINFPRDTYVEIPGRGRNKINAALELGGPGLVAATIERLTGVSVAFVLVTRFDGLKAMVDELGGLAIDIPFRMADRNSGAFFEAGPSRLGGGQALAFSRNRNVPGGDFTRTENQGRVILSALTQLRGEPAGPADTIRQLAVLGRHTDVNGVNLPELYRLGRLALRLDPANIRNVTMPGSIGQAGSASVVFPTGAAGGLFADFRDDAVLQSH